MDYNQRKRFDKLKYEDFYLLRVEKNNNEYTLTLTGSTKNIYKVRIFNKKIECDCPDFHSWCKCYNCYCKIFFSCNNGYCSLKRCTTFFAFDFFNSVVPATDDSESNFLNMPVFVVVVLLVNYYFFLFVYVYIYTYIIIYILL